MSSTYALGIDIGTGGCRGALLDLESLSVVAIEAVDSTVVHANARDLNVEELWVKVCEVTRRLCRRVHSADAIRAVCCASFGGALVCLDANGEIAWTSAHSDERPVSEVRELIQSGDSEWIYDITGDGVALSAIPRLAWLASHEPNVYRTLRCVLSVSDWLVFKLTGVLVTEPSLAASMGLVDVRSRTWSTALLSRAQIGPELLPGLDRSGTMVGTVEARAAVDTELSPMCAVVLGGWDTAVAHLGAELPKRGQLHVVGGSFWKTGVIFQPHLADPERRLRTMCHVLPGRWLMEGIGYCSGAAMRWFRDGFCPDYVLEGARLGRDPYELMEQSAFAVPPGSNGVLAVLANAMNARDWRHASAGFLQFDVLAPACSGRKECIRAIEEAAAYVVQAHRGALEHATGIKSQEVVLSGGAARAVLWPSVIADVLDLPVRATPIPEATAIGAARLAAFGLGCMDSIEDFAAATSNIGRIFEPKRENADRYADLFAQWQTVYPVLETATSTAGLRPLQR